LNLNKVDGGNRKFILIECQDYAETITAERVRRVISPPAPEGGVFSPPSKMVDFAPPVGGWGAFSFYKLGEPLLVEEMLNPKASIADIRQYIWYTETGNPCPSPSGRGVFAPLPEGEGQGVGYFLGNFQETAIYFYYQVDKATRLDYDFLATITEKSTYYLIYADVCYLSKEFMEANHIRFKKIPRDITRI
jgi:adenine-specific DNA-methyltransferase